MHHVTDIPNIHGFRISCIAHSYHCHCHGIPHPMYRSRATQNCVAFSWKNASSNSENYTTFHISFYNIRRHCQIVLSFLKLHFPQLNRSCVCVRTPADANYIISFDECYVINSWARSIIHITETNIFPEFIASDELKQNRHQKFWSVNERNHGPCAAHERHFRTCPIHCTLCAAYGDFKNSKKKISIWAVQYSATSGDFYFVVCSIYMPNWQRISMYVLRHKVWIQANRLFRTGKSNQKDTKRHAKNVILGDTVWEISIIAVFSVSQ